MLLRSLDAVRVRACCGPSCDTWARQQKAAGDPRTLDALRVHAALLHWCRLLHSTGTPITPAADAQTAAADA